uniref:cell surface A33 antigen-like isoform X3 n=1 Tax=Pristiophorus japonicus TaxID=55135 RepID=UPI00398EC21C
MAQTGSVMVRSELSANGWTMTIADAVSAEEGRSAVLPCSFTHPPTDRLLTGTVKWFKVHSLEDIFTCTYSGLGHSQGELCEIVRQQEGGNRFRFVGNLSNNDVSIMMERLSQADNAGYRCRVELNIGNFGTSKGTDLSVRAASGNDSVVRGTEGASVTLPCLFTPSDDTNPTVTWMRKEPYQHLVTFRAQSNGSWTTVNGGNRYELIGNPKEGNASTRIKQLSVKDNHTYLCLVEHKPRNNYINLSQTETCLQLVHEKPSDPTNKMTPIIALLPLLLILFILLILLIICRKKGGCSWLMGCTRCTKRDDPGPSSIAGTNPCRRLSAPVEDNSCTYAEIEHHSNGKAQPESDFCTYASIVHDDSRKDNRLETDAQDVIYAAVVTTQ